AMSAACERYKADNGTYPTDPATTETLDAHGAITWVAYQNASKFLYVQLSGDPDLNGGLAPDKHAYMQFKPATLGRTDMTQPPSGANLITYLRDPFGNSYGYSTIKAHAPPGGVGGY